AGELAGIGRQGGQLDALEAGGDVELLQRVEWVQFAGYRIRKGRLNLDLHYQIERSQLKAENKVLLEALQLGGKVDSPDAVDLPV
ncbi:DUF748 domain-containing protein, partial [Pseudomonas aeruginosa]